MKTSYFSFGWSHAHVYGGKTFDKDTIVKITSEDPRATMFACFGNKWSVEYETPPPSQFYKEIVEIS